MRSKHLAGQQCSGEVGLQDVIPFSLIHLQRGSALGFPGTIHQDLNAAKSGDGGIAQLLQAGGVGDIASHGQRAPLAAANLLHGFIDQGVAPAGRHHVSARLSQSFRQFQTNSRCSTDDDSSFAF